MPSRTLRPQSHALIHGNGYRFWKAKIYVSFNCTTSSIVRWALNHSGILNERNQPFLWRIPWVVRQSARKILIGGKDRRIWCNFSFSQIKFLQEGPSSLTNHNVSQVFLFVYRSKQEELLVLSCRWLGSRKLLVELFWSVVNQVQVKPPLPWVWQRVWEKRLHSPCLQVQKFSRSRCQRPRPLLKPSESQSVSYFVKFLKTHALEL